MHSKQAQLPGVNQSSKVHMDGIRDRVRALCQERNSLLKPVRNEVKDENQLKEDK